MGVRVSKLSWQRPWQHNHFNSWLLCDNLCHCQIDAVSIVYYILNNPNAPTHQYIYRYFHTIIIQPCSMCFVGYLCYYYYYYVSVVFLFYSHFMACYGVRILSFYIYSHPQCNGWNLHGNQYATTEFSFSRNRERFKCEKLVLMVIALVGCLCACVLVDACNVH